MHIFVTCLGETKAVAVQEQGDLTSLVSGIQNAFCVTSPLSLFTNSAKIEDIDGLTHGENVTAVVQLVGGGKGGKKRKAYATPKKNKHRHKNVKLMALNYYAIKGDGTVEKTRKLCEQETCKGKGIFMANHWNRYYCGKCALTLLKKDAPKEEPKKVKVVQPKVEAAKDDDKKKKKKK